MKPVLVAPLVALALAGGAAGAYFWVTSSGGEQEVVVQPTATPATTTVPLLTATAAPSPTPTPLPGGKAPEGCVATEKSYADPDGRFAFCYPAEMGRTTAPTQFGTATIVNYPDDQSNQVTINIGGTVDPYEPCIIQSPTVIKNEKTADLTISGQTVQACFRDHYDQTHPDVLLYKSIDFQAKTSDGKPVIVVLTYSGPEFQRDGVPLEDIAMRVLDSSVVY